MKISRFFWMCTAAALLALAAVFKLVSAGYGTTAVILAGAGLVIAFYTLTARWRARAAKPLRIIVTALLTLGVGLFLVAEILVIAGARSDEDPEADYVIVMGAGINGTSPSISLKERLEAALSYLNEYPNSIAIVSGGQGTGEVASEASVMAAWLQARGIDPARIVVEDQARSSYENLLYSLQIIEDLGGDPTGRVAIVSSEYHLYRIRLIGRALGCKPLCYAGHTNYRLLLANYAVREAFGVWRIWVLGPG